MLISSQGRQTQYYVYEFLPSPLHMALQKSHGAKSDQRDLCPCLTKWFLVFLALIKATPEDDVLTAWLPAHKFTLRYRKVFCNFASSFKRWESTYFWFALHRRLKTPEKQLQPW